MHEVWVEYRAAWRHSPWLIPFPIIGVLLLILGIIGTATREPAAILFVPGVLVLFLHHFLCARVRQ